MTEPTRDEKIEALRVEIMILEARVTTGPRHLAALLAILRDLEAGGWRPIGEKPAMPVAVEFYHEHWPGPPERYDHLRRSHGYWDGKDWRDDGTNHEIFECPDDILHHPTHWRLLSSPPAASDGGGQ